MTITPKNEPPESEPSQEQSAASPDPASLDSARDRALYEPLPSSEMFVACFAGARPLTGGDILDPAFELVTCQREERLAEAILMDETASLDELRTAGRTLVAARVDITMLVTIIDEAVRDRIKKRHGFDPSAARKPFTPADGLSGVVVHTESVGDVAARMAELWELLDAREPDDVDPPEAVLLNELCEGYDVLAAEIESGRRIPAGV